MAPPSTLAVAAAALLLVAVPGPSLARPLSLSEIRGLYGEPDFTSLPPLRYRTRGVDANQTLREAAKARGIAVGFAAARAHITNVSDPNFAAIGFSEFSLTTAENECKWSETEPENGAYTLSDCAFITDVTLTNMSGLARGHNLAWGNYNPSWLNSVPASQLMGVWTDHANHVLGSFGPDWVGVDVINEPICDDGKDCPAANGNVTKPYAPWWPAVPDFFDQAFTAAKAVVSTYKGKTTLFVNDYGAEGLGGKSDRMYGFVQGLLSRGVPVEGVGLQMHVSVDGFPAPADVAANIKRLGALGLQVHITEMDVRCDACTPARLDIQAQIYGGMLEACLNNTGVCTNFETWGLTDEFSWLGAQMVPLLWDSRYQKKPAYFEVLSVLQGK